MVNKTYVPARSFLPGIYARPISDKLPSELRAAYDEMKQSPDDDPPLLLVLEVDWRTEQWLGFYRGEYLWLPYSCVDHDVMYYLVTWDSE